jgi:hypothetical protein
MCAILQINTEFFTKQDQLVKSDENKDALKSLRKERHQKEVKVLTPRTDREVESLPSATESKIKVRRLKGAMPENATQED